MKKEKAILFTVLSAALFVIFLSQGLAATESDASSSSLMDQFHHPADWIEMGADLRFRMIWAKNIDSLSDDLPNNRENHWIFNRYRLRWWHSCRLDRRRCTRVPGWGTYLGGRAYRHHPRQSPAHPHSR